MKVYTRVDSKRVGLALPTYNRQSYNRVPLMNFARQFPESPVIEVASSALGNSFNTGYQAFRQLADEGKLDFFVMLHADVVPLTEQWGSILLDEILDTGADIVSTVLPIKSGSGTTSTAILPKTKDLTWNPIRFTMAEIFQLPETFTHPRLIVNTGLFVLDMRKEWTKKLVFDLSSHVNHEKYYSFFIPEDWRMSLDCLNAGGHIYATRKIVAQHFGDVGYPNNSTWGSKASEGAMELYLKGDSNERETT